MLSEAGRGFAARLRGALAAVFFLADDLCPAIARFAGVFFDGTAGLLPADFASDAEGSVLICATGGVVAAGCFLEGLGTEWSSAEPNTGRANVCK